MSEPKWTPGPWNLRVRGFGGCCEILGPRPITVDVLSYNAVTGESRPDSHTQDDIILRTGGAFAGRLVETDVANGQLAAAAPDLYKFLSQIVESGILNGSQEIAVRGLLAKARGEK